MAFIAGYLSSERAYDTAERVRSFAILPSDSPATPYEHAVVPTKFGHLIVKHKKTYPVKPRLITDTAGNALATLGFLTRENSLLEAKDLLASCMGDSARVLEDCQGEFVVILAEAASGAIHIVNDRFAARPFYVVRAHDGVYFSSNLAFLLHLARVSYRTDVLGWLQVFSLKHTCGNTTTAREVERLGPGTHLTLLPDRVKEHRYWRLEHRPEPDLDPVVHGARVFEAFQAGAAFRARLLGRGVLALSGGLDSRLIAAALPTDVDYAAFTFVDRAQSASTPQTEAAAAVCRALGLKHEIRAIPSGWYSRRAPDVLALTDGLRPFHHMAIAMAYVDEVKRRGTAFLLGGGPGDVLAGSYIPSVAYLDPREVDQNVEDFCLRRSSRGDLLALLFRDDVLRNHRDAVHRSLVASFTGITGPTAAHRVTAWAMVCRQPAFTFTSVLHTHPEVAEAFCHLDYTYTDLMLQLPAEWLYDENFYAFMLYQNLPKLRHVPYANTGALISGRLTTSFQRESPVHGALASARDLGKRVVGRLVRAIGPRSAPDMALFQRDDTLLSELEECLHSSVALREILDVRKCDAFLDKVRAGVSRSYGHQELLGGLASMCFSQRILAR